MWENQDKSPAHLALPLLLSYVQIPFISTSHIYNVMVLHPHEREIKRRGEFRQGKDPVVRVSTLHIPRSLFKQSCTKRSSSSSPLPSLALVSGFSFSSFPLSR